MKTLPLFYYPTTWVWIDDDKNLLSVMVEAFSKKNPVLPFHSPKDCCEYLKKYTSPLTKHYFLEADIKDENYGVMQRTPLNFDINSILKLLENSKRHEEISVMVIDYQMPEINGLELAELTRHLLIPKILLTGNPEEENAINGFNNDLIHRFIQKSTPNMLHKLTDYLQRLTFQYFQIITAPLLSYLETDGKLPLSDPVFIDFFETYCQQHNIKEYYLIDKQGSLLCIDASNNTFCLVIHTERSIKNWLEMYENEKLINSQDIEKIKEHKKIPFFGVQTEAWQIKTNNWSDYLYNPEILQGREKYLLCTSSLSIQQGNNLCEKIYA